MDANEFWSRVDKSGECWEWTAGYTAGSYGSVSVLGIKATGAHRVAYILTYGEIPDGLVVCHRCDNRRCVRPEHLFLGTHQDNMRDKVAKGRAKGPQIVYNPPRIYVGIRPQAPFIWTTHRCSDRLCIAPTGSDRALCGAPILAVYHEAGVGFDAAYVCKRCRNRFHDSYPEWFRRMKVEPS